VGRSSPILQNAHDSEYHKENADEADDHKRGRKPAGRTGSYTEEADFATCRDLSAILAVNGNHESDHRKADNDSED
jgi:hypothetical protein